ncbi:peptidoglycan-binding protein [Actinoplanes sp. NPDC049681]|uniref:peptidoglycan-binding protein n=1 Tax=Actinoplanes sp. NPDC049681 TaxID=3363905 RepID=UPI0037B828CB
MSLIRQTKGDRAISACRPPPSISLVAITARSPERTNGMATYSQFVKIALTQQGDPYVFGSEAEFDDPNPDSFDCSELVEWAAARCDVTFVDGAQNQRDACRKAHKLISVERACKTRGALLFRIDEGPSNDHVAISLGNGKTIEARGRKYGVNKFPVEHRGWTHGGLVPGLHADKHHELLELGCLGEEVRWVQRRLQMHGFDPGPADGVYGRRTDTAVRDFQKKHHLEVDGVVGPITRSALSAAPAQHREPAAALT